MATADRVAELYHSGRLAELYPDVRQLLTEVAGDELARAGRLLARVDPEEIRRAHPDVPAITIAVTGHGTLAPLIPALTAEVARHGMLLRSYISDFDGYALDLGDPGSDLYAADPDMTVCVLDPAMIFDEVPVPWRPADVAGALDRKLRLIEGLAAKYAAAARGPLVLNTCPLPARYAAQLVDYRSRGELSIAWREGMVRLLRLGQDGSAVTVMDTDPLVAEGLPADDPRADIYAGMHLPVGLLERYARELAHLARHVRGRAKKCLVVDLDETLWGGVLGEDGPEGIEVADGRRGAAFRAFQRTVKQIAGQGVLLAAVSKNDLEPVRRVLSDHAGMTLRDGDFVRVVANWRPKHENVAELAKELNIGVDSLVFTDDSPYECGLVRRELPEVDVVRLDNEPALHAARLLADSWFGVPALTADDLARPARYREEAARREFLDSFHSLAAYLAELSVRVSIRRAIETDIDRVSQLTLRTNQFNMTTERLQPADVAKLIGSSESPVLTISSGDRFGDNGLVGAIFLRLDGGVLRIDNFLLSCRVFARGIEQACLAAIVRYAAERDATQVQGCYRPSAKNGKVADFYPSHGFAPLAGSDGVFRRGLVPAIEPPPHVEMTLRLEEIP